MSSVRVTPKVNQLFLSVGFTKVCSQLHDFMICCSTRKTGILETLITIVVDKKLRLWVELQVCVGFDNE